MKPVILATAIFLCTSGLAVAQSSIATAPANRSTGPTVPDTRKLDQMMNAPTGNSSITAPNSTSDNHGNWRASSGLNADPDNPSGAPGPGAGLGTSPTR